MYDLDKIRIDVRNFCRDINKEGYMNWADLKDELNVSVVYEKYKHLFSKELILEITNQRKHVSGEEATVSSSLFPRVPFRHDCEGTDR